MDISQGIPIHPNDKLIANILYSHTGNITAVLRATVLRDGKLINFQQNCGLINGTYTAQTFAIELCEGILIGASISNTQTGHMIYGMSAQLSLGRYNNKSYQPYHILCSGFVEQLHPLSWSVFGISKLHEYSHNFRDYVSGGAVGGEWSFGAIGYGLYVVKGIQLKLTCDATAHDRFIRLQIRTGSSAFAEIPVQHAITASEVTYIFFNKHIKSEIVYSDRIYVPFEEQQLSTLHTIYTVTDGIQAGDQYNSSVVVYDLFPGL